MQAVVLYGTIQIQIIRAKSEWNQLEITMQLSMIFNKLRERE